MNGGGDENISKLKSATTERRNITKECIKLRIEWYGHGVMHQQ
jgi:hypothetical protein